MINSPSVHNIYNDFLRPKEKTPQCPANNQGLQAQNSIASVQLGDAAEDKKSHALTAAVASVAILGGAIGLFFVKGASSKFYKNLNSYMQKLDDKIYELSQNSKSLGTIQKGYLKFNESLRKILDYLKIGNNITAIKDAGFKWVCDKLYLTKPMNWITEQFKKITVRTSRLSYENARNLADANIAKLRDYIPLLKDTNPQAAAELQQLLQKLESEVLSITNATTRNKRLKTIENATKNVGDDVTKDLKALLKNRKENIEKWNIYRTEVHSADGREKLVNELKDAQRNFTFNIEDKVRLMSEYTDEIGRIIKPDDKESRALLRQIRKQIKHYAKLSGNNEDALRNNLSKRLSTNLHQLQLRLEGKNPDNNEFLSILKNNIDNFNEILRKNNDKGTIEEILTLLNQSGLKKSDIAKYTKAKNLTDEIRKATNAAFESELKLYDKFAEYSVGSAPTDVLGMILPAGLAAYAISKGDDKDAKVSATLKSGIPILGGVATTFIAAAKMMTNMQGLLLGTLTGFVLNALGSKADEAVKQYKENNLFTQKALAAYRKNNPGNIS